MIVSSDPLARRGFSHSAFWTDCKDVYVGLIRVKPRRASVSAMAFMNTVGYPAVKILHL
jgi:hypothetical protein